MNAINIISPYKHMDMWVFDDPSVGLEREPFVAGADTMIDRIVADIPEAERGFVLVFSASPFPGHQYRLEWRRSEGGGDWYYSPQLGMEGWLCPALLRYFAEAPKALYIQVKAMLRKDIQTLKSHHATGFNFMKGGSFIYRIWFALRGIGATWISEKNFRIHIVAAVFVIVLLSIIQPAAVWWALLLIMTGLVLAAELFNTALEKLIDHLHPDQDDAVKIVKDTLAGAVLALSITAAAVFGVFLWSVFKP